MSFILHPLLSFDSVESSSESLTSVLDDCCSDELKDVLLRSVNKKEDGFYLLVKTIDTPSVA